MKTYVTYGKGNTLDYKKLAENMSLNNRLSGKPTRCLWGSPIDSKYGWKEWCLYENYWDESMFTDDNTILWTFTPHSTILSIKDYDDILRCVSEGYIYKDNCNYPTLNFVKIFYEGYSAIELLDSNIGNGLREYERVFYGWDCESIVVLDPSKIFQIDKDGNQINISGIQDFKNIVIGKAVEEENRLRRIREYFEDLDRYEKYFGY